MTDAFYERIDERTFRPTIWTRGPWGPESQHGGPPSALLGRAIEQVNDRADLRVARVTLDILRPVPLQPLEVQAEVVRPGRSVELVHASLRAGDEEVMRAAAWRIHAEVRDVPKAHDPEHVPPPAQGVEVPTFATGYEGYLQAMEWSFVGGEFVVPGPATAWLRMRKPLISGEPVSPLTRVLIATDSASGISAALDFKQWLFVNPDLSVYLHRLPAREWICLDAVTTIDAEGIGLAAAAIHDEDGPLGRSLQSLFVAPRSR